MIDVVDRSSVNVPTPPAPSERRSPYAWLPWIDDAFAATPDRARHSRGVWRRIVGIGGTVRDRIGADRLALLELAALVHDLGRAIDPADTEPHGFVGARYLERLGLDDVAPIVAHHSGARLEAELRGMAHHDRWPDPDRELVALLSFADATVDHTGRVVTLEERHRGLVKRYGTHSYQVRRFELLRRELAFGEVLARGAAGIGTCVGTPSPSVGSASSDGGSRAA